MALKKLEGLNPDRLRYEIFFADGALGYEQLGELRRFVREPERAYGPDLDTARRLTDRILQVDGARARRVILFGSRARGDARSDSDYDLLVLVRGMTADEARTYRLELWRALRGAGVSAEPWVMDEAEFEESKAVIGGLAHPAWAEGVLLHENS